MKNLSLFIIALLFVGASANAQGLVYGKGSSAINLGVGFGSTVITGTTGFAPSFSASYEYGILEIPIGSNTGVVSAGGIFGFGTASYNYTNWQDLKYKYNYFLVAARGNFHFIFHDQFDPYAGFLLGYSFVNGKWVGDGTKPNNWNATSNGFQGGAYAGARWFFTPAIAAFAEVGWSISILTVGVTFKFPAK